MSTTATNTNPVPTTPAKPRRKKPGRAVVMSNIPWDTYVRLLKVFESQPRVRLTYDQGDLEIMVPSQEHEGDGHFISRMIVILTEELGLPVRGGGSTTLKRKRMRKGLEPDKCFWIGNAGKLAGVKQLDLKIHPPPDLAFEVDVTSSSIDRFDIYRSLGVPELWRLAGDTLRFHVLDANKKYVEAPTSPTFAGIAPSDLIVFVKQARGVVDQNMTARAFREWVRQRMATSAAPPPATPGS